jgi:hypothetical protein
MPSAAGAFPRRRGAIVSSLLKTGADSLDWATVRAC